MTIYLRLSTLVLALAALSCSDATTTKPGEASPKHTTPQRLNGDGFSIQKPNGYHVPKRTSSEMVLADRKRPNAYTANIFIAKPPIAMIERASRCVVTLRGQGANETTCCRELAKGFATGAQVRLRDAKMIQAPWGRTCQIEAERPAIQATVLTTVMKTNSGYVVVVGHFGIGDTRARSTYGQLISSWKL